MDATLAAKIISATDAKVYQPATGVQVTPAEALDLQQNIMALDDGAYGRTFDLENWFSTTRHTYPETGQPLGRRNDSGLAMAVLLTVE